MEQYKKDSVPKSENDVQLLQNTRIQYYIDFNWFSPNLIATKHVPLIPYREDKN